MVKREQYVIAGLLGVGAIVLLWYLSRHGVSTSATAGTTPGPDGLPVVADNHGAAGGLYPNSEPIQMGDIVIGGTPINLSYNQLPGGQNSLPQIHIGPSAVATNGDRPGCCNDCDSVGPVSVQTFSAQFLQRAASNFSRFGQVPGGSSAPVGAAGKVVS